MKQYPLRAPTADPVAELVVGHINMEMRQSIRPVRIFERDAIARAIQCDPEAVGEVLMNIDASDNGLTVCKGEWPHDSKSN